MKKPLLNKELIVKLYYELKNAPLVAQTLCCSSSSVYRLLIENNTSANSLNKKRPFVKKFSDNEENDIVNHHLSGKLTLKCIASLYDCSEGCIRKILERKEIPPHRQGRQYVGFNKEDTLSILKYWNDKLSVGEIAKKMKCSSKKIKNFFCHILIKYEPRYLSGRRHPKFILGIITNSNGVKKIKLNYDDPCYSLMDKSGYAPLSRVVASKKSGHVLRKDQTVHHINGERSDDNSENLQVRNGQHGSGIIYICENCKSSDIIFEPTE